MIDIALDRNWELLGWMLALKREAFRLSTLFWTDEIFPLVVVLVAGLSQAIAQSIILFINKVKPIRFIFSLLLNAVLFTVGCIFLVLSTWVTTLIPWTSIHVPLKTLATVIGLSYAPLLFSFLGALPYLGVPILSVLSIWHLLALVVSFSGLAEISAEEAFGYVALGWLVLQILQQTIGQPIANFGRWISNQAAGVDLSDGQQELLDIVNDRIATVTNNWQDELEERIQEIRQNGLLSPFQESSTIVRQSQVGFLQTRSLATFLSLLGIAILTFLVVVLLHPVREWLLGWEETLPTVVQFGFDLFWISLIAIVVAGLLAPLETLGWWAGWYEDNLDTTVNAGKLAEPIEDPKAISRYVVYLDGIGKSTFEYLPDIEEFLNTLTPTLPDGIALIRGIMPYSVVNNPLDEDRPLSFLWKLAERSRLANPASVLGLLVNIRNVITVGVSADQRYGPLYNQGIAQVIYNGLINNGYKVGSRIPITLMGYSGGGQMAAACAPFLKWALRTPIEVISLGGVISGNCNILRLEHLYHLVGEKDVVERIGPIMFPGRWKLFLLSYWNRAKRRGKITFVSLGPVAHQVPGGMLDPNVILPDGRTALKQTIDDINAILRGNFLSRKTANPIQPSNYQLYQQAQFNRPDYYPIHQSLPSQWYQPIGTWMGRLILPKLEERHQVQGALFEVYHTDENHQHLIGQTINLRFSHNPATQSRIRSVKRDVHFSAEASYTSKYGGLIHPDRLDRWLQVEPLESLAGSRPNDDMIVMLDESLEVREFRGRYTLFIDNQPIQITGRFYALIKFLHPVLGTDRYSVVHYNRASGGFDGLEETVRIPHVIADQNGCFPSTSRDIEQFSLNEKGWYIYGAQDASGQFVVQSLAPRALFQLQPDAIITGKQKSYHYIRKQSWAHITAKKGQISSVLLSPEPKTNPIDDWQEGDRALVLHTYGGIGGKNKEPAAATPIFFGHFAYGMAQVVREPLTDELRFDIRYYQVYTHNTDGMVAGILHWSRFLGDRQFGWVGVRPVSDILIKLESFTGYYDFNGVKRSPLDLMLAQLQAMTSRYRIGDGTGGTYVGPANNCSQDSNKALFASLQQIDRSVRLNLDKLREWEKAQPEQARRFAQLLQLDKTLRMKLQPLGGIRSDWEHNEFNLGSTLEDRPLHNLITGLASWRTMFPRLASDTLVKIFLDRGASVWVLRTNQIGGDDPDIEPIAPMTF